jgi:hypothetical protein
MKSGDTNVIGEKLYDHFDFLHQKKEEKIE